MQAPVPSRLLPNSHEASESRPLAGVGLSRMSRRVDVVVRSLADRRAEWSWFCSGRRGPLPARAKRALLRDYGRRFGLKTLVETGTYLGDTVAALVHDFSQIYSIELAPDLARRAGERFRAVPHVKIVAGDSATVLPQLLASVSESSLFWLDGHYSGGITARGPIATPVIGELRAIFAHPIQSHIVLIDDASWVGTQLTCNGLDDLLSLIRSTRPGWTVEVRDDVIRAHAPSDAILT